LCRLYCAVWWNRFVVCLLEWELWCFNELKRLLILNLITLLPPSRLLAFTLTAIYGSFTLCFLINHLVIHVILFRTWPCHSSQKSCLFSELQHTSLRCRSEFCFHNFSICHKTTCASKNGIHRAFWNGGKIPTGNTDSRVKPKWHTDLSLSGFFQCTKIPHWLSPICLRLNSTVLGSFCSLWRLKCNSGATFSFYTSTFQFVLVLEVQLNPDTFSSSILTVTSMWSCRLSLNKISTSTISNISTAKVQQQIFQEMWGVITLHIPKKSSPDVHSRARALPLISASPSTRIYIDILTCCHFSFFKYSKCISLNLELLPVFQLLFFLVSTLPVLPYNTLYSHLLHLPIALNLEEFQNKFNSRGSWNF